MKLPLLLTNSFSRGQLYYKINAWFFPRQTWLTKTIPNTWCDKTSLIPQMLFTCLVHFVEDENGLDQLNVDWSDDLKKGYVSQEYLDSIQTQYGLLKDVYDYVKYGRTILEKRMDNAYPPLPDDLFETKRVLTPLTEKTYEELYGEVNRLEKELDDKDQWAMKAIVEHVGILWT